MEKIYEKNEKDQDQPRFALDRIDKVPDLGVHILNTPWVLWYHSSDNNDWSIDGYQQIIEIGTVEEFWLTFNKIRDFTIGMFFLMRKDHLPIWESYQRPVHFLKYRSNKRQFYQQWLNLCKALIGETLLAKSDSTSDVSEVVGVSLSPKFKNLIIKIWTHHTSLPELNPQLEIASETPIFE